MLREWQQSASHLKLESWKLETFEQEIENWKPGN